MPYRLLVIESESDAATATVHADLGSDLSFVCRRTSWNQLLPHSLDQTESDLIVAVAPPQTAAVLPLFEGLRRHPLRVPIFAVLPENPDELLLESISRTAD